MPLRIPLSPNDTLARSAIDRRRLAVITINGDLLLNLITANGEQGYIHRLGEHEIPKDARVVGFTHDPTTNAFRMFLHSATFEPCGDSEIPNELQVQFRQIRLPTKRDIEVKAAEHARQMSDGVNITAAARSMATTSIARDLLHLLIDHDVIADE